MVRVKRSVASKKKRKKALKEAKGFKWGRKSKYKLAKDALRHAWEYSFRDRKNKKRTFRRLWQSQINSACKQRDLRYSQFINLLKKKDIQLDRKILSTLAKEEPEIFDKITEEILEKEEVK